MARCCGSRGVDERLAVLIGLVADVFQLDQALQSFDERLHGIRRAPRPLPAGISRVPGPSGSACLAGLAAARASSADCAWVRAVMADLSRLETPSISFWSAFFRSSEIFSILARSSSLKRELALAILILRSIRARSVLAAAMRSLRLSQTALHQAGAGGQHAGLGAGRLQPPLGGLAGGVVARSGRRAIWR